MEHVGNNKLTTPQQQRQAAVSHIPRTGTAQKGPATPRSRNKSTSPGSSDSQRSSPGPHSASRGNKRPVTAPRTFDQIQAEYLYLFSNLQQQEARMRTLVAALATVQSQLQQPSTTAEARRLRKNAGFIKSKISDAEQQERLALLGIGHVGAELQSRYRHLQLQQHLDQQLQHIQSHAPTQAAHFYGPIHGETHYPVQPQTPYLVPQSELAFPFPGSHEEAHGLGMNGTGMTAITPISPDLWQERRGSGEVEFMSPMSPLAPVFQPGASFFFGGTGTVMADAADNNDADSGDAAAKQESLGGTTFTGEAEDERTVDFTSQICPETGGDAGDATPIQRSLETGAGTGVAAMHYVLDTYGNGDSDDLDAYMPRKIRLRRGSHDDKQQQQPLTSAREKRLSLPPVRFSYPEEE